MPIPLFVWVTGSGDLAASVAFLDDGSALINARDAKGAVSLAIPRCPFSWFIASSIMSLLQNRRS